MEKLISFYSVWPALACVAVVLLFARTPIFRFADAPPSYQPRRILTMDGLRGLLALAVVFHHAAIYHFYLLANFRDNSWFAPPSRFFASVGPAGVSMFFMITGYLFWSRLIAEHARLDWGKLYVGRIFRIGPLYLAALAVASLLDHLARVSAPPTSVLKQVSTWSAGIVRL